MRSSSIQSRRFGLVDQGMKEMEQGKERKMTRRNWKATLSDRFVIHLLLLVPFQLAVFSLCNVSDDSILRPTLPAQKKRKRKGHLCIWQGPASNYRCGTIQDSPSFSSVDHPVGRYILNDVNHPTNGFSSFALTESYYNSANTSHGQCRTF